MIFVLLAAALLVAPVGNPVASVPSGTPVEYIKVTSGFGYRHSDRRFHPGVDLSAAVGTPIQTTAGGKVVYAGQAGGYGLLLIIDHGNGIQTWFAHLSRILFRRGSAVAPGQVVARVGNSGHTTGPHLHYEVRINHVPTDPMRYMTEDRE